MSCPVQGAGDWLGSALRQELPVATRGCPSSPGGKVRPGTEGPPRCLHSAGWVSGLALPSLPEPGYRPNWVKMAPASECPGRKESFMSHFHLQCLGKNSPYVFMNSEGLFQKHVPRCLCKCRGPVMPMFCRTVEDWQAGITVGIAQGLGMGG